MSKAMAAGALTAPSIGFGGLLGIVFIILKLIGEISWSWWLVLLPIYGPQILVVILLVIVVVFVGRGVKAYNTHPSYRF